jgi:hypothetical protein
LRIDQVLKFAWKGLFELTMINIVVTAILIFIWPEPTTAQLWYMAAVNWPVAIVSIWAVSKLLGTPAYEQTQPDLNAPTYPVGSENIPASSAYVPEVKTQTSFQEGGD